MLQEASYSALLSCCPTPREGFRGSAAWALAAVLVGLLVAAFAAAVVLRSSLAVVCCSRRLASFSSFSSLSLLESVSTDSRLRLFCSCTSLGQRGELPRTGIVGVWRALTPERILWSSGGLSLYTESALATSWEKRTTQNVTNPQVRSDIC